MKLWSEETIENILVEKGWKSISENFTNEGVDLKMLLSFEEEDLKDCLKEIGIKRFGDRYKVLEIVRPAKRAK